MTQQSWATNEGTRKSMLGNRRRDTSPEWRVRRLLHARGLRYRVDAPLAFDRRRRADITFTRARVIVFIDGCYWHGCPRHYVAPKSHADYWVPKIAGNARRDIETTERLVDEGWTVLRFWEHDEPTAVVDAIERAVRPRVSPAWRPAPDPPRQRPLPPSSSPAPRARPGDPAPG